MNIYFDNILWYFKWLKLRANFCAYSGSAIYYTCIGITFFVPRVKPAALPLVRCYSIRFPGGYIASRVNNSRQQSESFPVGATPVILYRPWLMQYDVENSDACDSNSWPVNPESSVLPSHHYTIAHLIQSHVQTNLNTAAWNEVVLQQSG